MLRVLLAFLVAFTAALFVTPKTIPLANKVGACDKPDARKVHVKVMTRLGGLGIYVGFLCGFLVYGDFSREMTGLLLSASFITLVGFVDDIKDIPPKVKLLGQVVAAIMLMTFGVRLEYLTVPFTGTILDVGVWGYLVSFLWLVGVCNAVNLIDGLDGLAGGISCIAAVTLGVVAYNSGYYSVTAICILMFGSTMGFLRWNFHPAKLFMGDSGSLLLGFLLAAVSLMELSQGGTVLGISVPILILGIPILDTLFAIVRRKYNHKPIFEADKGHFHHRLLAMGFSHGDVVLLIYGVTCLFGSVAILITLLPAIYGLISVGIAFGFVIIGAVRLGIFRG